MQKKAFVLLSGGLDSTTCLYKAIYDFAPESIPFYKDPSMIAEWISQKHRQESNETTHWVEAVSINYGQRHVKEMEHAYETCKLLGINYTILSIPGLLTDENTMLAAETQGSIEVPDIDYADIKGVSPTYVPNRNMTMLSLLVAHAQKYVNAQIIESADLIHCAAEPEDGDKPIDMPEAMQIATNRAKDLCGVYFGAHAEDAHNWAYPDCTPEFIGAMANAISVASYYAIRLHAPLMNLDKKGIVKLGTELGVPFENTWSCYKGELRHCGTCPTCRSRRQAFTAAGIQDPTQYAGGN
jgi:7-cyano-7-deazaguanine synthase